MASDINISKIINELFAEPIVKRLSRVRHFGAFEIDDWHGKIKDDQPPTSRLDHTIGVTKIAIDAATSSVPDERIAYFNVIYAILHDVGHGPFSHSSEPAFRKLGIDHHIAFKEILFSKSYPIYELLSDNGIDVPDFYRFFSAPSEYNLFSYNINPDLLDGMRLSLKRLTDENIDVLTSPSNIIADPINHQDELDEIWRCKSYLYCTVMPHSNWKVYDLLFDVALIRLGEKISRSDFYLDDDEFLGKFGRFIQRELWGHGGPMTDMERQTIAGSLRAQGKRQIQVSLDTPLTSRAAINLRYTDTAM